MFLAFGAGGVIEVGFAASYAYGIGDTFQTSRVFPEMVLASMANVFVTIVILAVVLIILSSFARSAVIV